MKYLLENARYAVVIAVFVTLIGSLSVFLMASLKMSMLVYTLFQSVIQNQIHDQTANIVSILDTFLLGVILYVFSVALYELFIGSVDLPKWMLVKNLEDLKKKLSSVIALILAVTFLEHVVEWRDPKGTLMLGISIAVLIGSLVLYMYIKTGDKS